LDREALHKGEAGALSEVVDALAPEIWRLVRSGFAAADEHAHPVLVKPLGRLGEVEEHVEMTLSAVLSPEQRRTASGLDDVRTAARREARTRLLIAARKSGRMVSLPEHFGPADLPPGIDDLDRALASEAPLSEAPTAIDAADRAPLEAALLTVRSFVGALDERGRTLVERRFGHGETHRAIAERFTCGAAAVAAHERRIRHGLRAALRATGQDLGRDRASQDALLGRALSATGAATGAATGTEEEALGGRLFPVTLERLRHAVLTRTFQEEPRPYGERLRWALAAAAAAIALYAMMLFGILPAPARDHSTRPRIVLGCAPSCTPGGSTTVRVLAPKDARKVAILLEDERGALTPLLTNPSGGSLHLPATAHHALVELPYPATLPAELRPGTELAVVAVFSRTELGPKTLLGSERPARSARVSSASTAIALRARP
jgi:DNA-directed RNA polymerase specialized sigma24 family protein